MNKDTQSWSNSNLTEMEELLHKVQQLERENAALRCQAIGQEETIERLQDDNAALRENKKRLLGAIDAVLCDPEGQACFRGSDEDRAVIQDAIDAARAEEGQL